MILADGPESFKANLYNDGASRDRSAKRCGGLVAPHASILTLTRQGVVMFHRVMVGDAAECLADIEEKTVQTCITSPPYFGLRDYDHPAQIGTEQTLKAYVESILSVMRGVHRTLRDNGTAWINIGDSYEQRSGRASPKTKAGDLIGVPWAIANAMRDDGWYLRSEVIWRKTNSISESAHDRPTRAHEQVFLFSKKRDYFYDDEATKEPTSDGKGMRQKRDVWDYSVARSKGAHFAVYPEHLVEPMILAATSKYGVCWGCSMTIYRDTKRTRVPTRPGTNTKATGDCKKEGNRDPQRHITITETMGWSCNCRRVGPEDGQYIPIEWNRQSVVLDPFLGSGTTSAVAKRLGRSSVGIELNPEYAKMAEERIKATDGPEESRQVGRQQDRPTHRPTDELH